MQQFDSHKDKSEVDELSETGVEYRARRGTSHPGPSCVGRGESSS